MPKDTLAWIQLGTDSVVKVPRVRSHKLPDLQGDWLAYLLEKPEAAAGGPGKLTSLTRIRQNRRRPVLTVLPGWRQSAPADPGGRGGEAMDGSPGRQKGKLAHGRDYRGRHGADCPQPRNRGAKRNFRSPANIIFNRNGNTLVVGTTRKKSDSSSKARVIWVNTTNGHADTIMTGF